MGAQELFTEKDRNLSIEPEGHLFSSWRNFFIHLDGVIKYLGKSSWKPFRKKALKKAEKWILALSKRILDATLIVWNSKKKKIPCLQRLPQK